MQGTHRRDESDASTGGTLCVRTALQLALAGGHRTTLRVLVELGGDIEAETDTGSSLLHASRRVTRHGQDRKSDAGACRWWS